eukprot:jgi/Mesvir1/11692/Mv00084-RA.1
MAATKDGRHVRVVVIGDEGAGKTSLITAAANDIFPDSPPPLMQPTLIPAEAFPDRVPLLIVDTRSKPEHRAHLVAECQLADVVVICCSAASQRAEGLDRVMSYWIPELRRINVTVPVVLVICKLDLASGDRSRIDEAVSVIMNNCREIEACIMCSARKLDQVSNVFCYAQRAVLHPIGPIFDVVTQQFKPVCLRALRRIFKLCDRDNDNALNDLELNAFQMACFQAYLQPEELEGVKRVVAERFPQGVHNNAITLPGFLVLHAMFIEKGRMETTWTVLRQYGYGDDLRLRDELLQSPCLKCGPDQSVELTEDGVDFFRDIFSRADKDHDGALSPREVDDLYAIAPCGPLEGQPYEGALVDANSMGAVTLRGFLAQWHLITLLDPKNALAYVHYLGGYVSPDEAARLFRITRRRRVGGGGAGRRLPPRGVTVCHVFGAKGSGSAALLHALVGRPYNEAAAASSPLYASGVVNIDSVAHNLVLYDAPEEAASQALSPTALAACDVAAFVFDSTSPESFSSMRAMVMAVAQADVPLPCVLVATKEGAGMAAEVEAGCKELCAALGIAPPVSVSAETGTAAPLFTQLLEVSSDPVGHIPETAEHKAAKRRRADMIRYLKYSAGAAESFSGDRNERHAVRGRWLKCLGDWEVLAMLKHWGVKLKARALSMLNHQDAGVCLKTGAAAVA